MDKNIVKKIFNIALDVLNIQPIELEVVKRNNGTYGKIYKDNDKVLKIMINIEKCFNKRLVIETVSHELAHITHWEHDSKHCILQQTYENLIKQHLID